MLSLVCIHHMVEAPKHTSYQNDAYSQRREKAVYTPGTQILALEPVASGLVFYMLSHALAPELPWRPRHAPARAALSSSCERRTTATNHRSPRALGHPPRSHLIAARNSVRSSRTNPGSASATSNSPARPSAGCRA